MPRRLANLFLLGSVVLLVATGLLPWLFPESVARPLYVVHRIAGVALVLSLGRKYAIVRGALTRRLASPRHLALPRRDLTLIASAGASLALALTVVIGLAWTAGLVSFDRPIPYSALNVHVFIGAALVPLVVLHAMRRWERRPPATRLLGRRAALRVLGLGAAATVVTAALDGVAPLRRLTGSRPAGSFTGNAFPLTIWNIDSVPTIDPRTWQLTVAGAVSEPRTLAYEELGALARRELDAVIDCTGGWWSEQRWSGVGLAELVRSSGPTAAASRVRVVSVTGHAWTFGLDEIGEALLATHVGGERISAGHGYPLRLVVPGRRGFQWIKWVGRVEVT